MQLSSELIALILAAMGGGGSAAAGLSWVLTLRYRVEANDKRWETHEAEHASMREDSRRTIDRLSKRLAIVERLLAESLQREQMRSALPSHVATGPTPIVGMPIEPDDSHS